ncbi:MAG: endonuclease/exonuclease/phosphatase family protein, partial [Chloroflexota bacterium]
MQKRHIFIILALIALILAACGGGATESPAPTAAPPVEPSAEPAAEPVLAAPTEPAVLISEVLTGVDGNNNFEFIELCNIGSQTPFDIKGWSIWYKLADGQDETLVYRWSEHALIPPQGHYLLGRAGQDLGISPDALFEQPLVGPKGSLQLRLTDGSVVDSISWGGGTVDFAEGSPALAMENGIALERAPGGEAGNWADSGDNAADFALNSAPNPQNTGSLATPDAGAKLILSAEAPQTVSPGSQFDYLLSVTNETGQALSGVVVQFPIMLDLEIIVTDSNVEISGQDAYWGMGHIGETHQVALWSLGSLAAGETVTTEITVSTPWTYLTALAANYSVQAEDWAAPAFGGPVRTAIEGGTIPIGTARTIIGPKLSIEGIATMYTGGYFAGAGHTKIYLADESGGIQVWIPNGEGIVNVALGARVRVFGTIEMYRGAVEFISNTPQDVEIITPAGEDGWPPTPVSIAEAVTDATIPGLLVQVAGLVTRVDEFTYSYELDLMDEAGETLTLYVDKQTNINVEAIETGQQYRASGILETSDTKQQLYPRIQADLEQIYPPVLILELEAPITIVSGDTLEVTLTAVNHTPDPMTNVIITATLPLQGAQFDSASEGGQVSGSHLIWNIPELASDGASVSVSFQIVATAAEGYLSIQDYAATAEEWTDPVTGVPHYVFLGDTVPVWAIQGQGFRSPYVLDPVSTAGIVTGVFPDLGGFWIQESHTDADPLTSSGLFISTGEATVSVNVGDEVQISGLVREASQQTQVQISAPGDVLVLTEGNPLPPAVELDPPLSTSESNAYYEAIEGMLALVSGPAVAVSPTSKYGEYVIVLPYHDVERLWQGDDAMNGIGIMVDDGSDAVHTDRATLPYAVNSGDRVAGLLGPVAYTYEQYKIQPVTAPKVVAGVTELPTLTPASPDEFSLMTWNVENLFDTRDPHPSDPPRPTASEYQVSIAKVANTILAAGAPTIVGLQEVENIGILEDIAAHEALIGYGYEAFLIEGTDSRGIDNGYLVRGDVAAVVTVEQHAAPEGLTSRPPLLIEVEVQTASGPVTVFVANNHFTSMSAGVEATEPRRTAQAAWNVSVLEGVLAANPEAYAAVIGDLNSFYDSLPIDTLREAGLKHVFDLLPGDERYSYIYQGASHTLDHILVTPALFELIQRVEVLRVNADYALPIAGDESPMHKSDHDPVVVVFL